MTIKFQFLFFPPHGHSCIYQCPREEKKIYKLSKLIHIQNDIKKFQQFYNPNLNIWKLDAEKIR